MTRESAEERVQRLLKTWRDAAAEARAAEKLSQAPMTPEQRAKQALDAWRAASQGLLDAVVADVIRAAQTETMAGAFQPPPETWPTQPVMPDPRSKMPSVLKHEMQVMSARVAEMRAALERIRREDREDGRFAEIADSVLTETQDRVKPEPKPTPLEAIGAERKRQIEVEEFTAEIDDEYVRGELFSAALCYLIQAQCWPSAPKYRLPGVNVPLHWPLPTQWWKPTSVRRCLEKAGALAMAERDRIWRAEKSLSHVGHCNSVRNMAAAMLQQLDVKE